MISHIFVILSVFAFFSVVYSAPLYCDSPSDNPLRGVINSDVIVDGQNCTMVGATINGDVTVRNGGFLRTYTNTVLQKKLTGIEGAIVEIYESTVNGRVYFDYSERLILTGSKINGRVSASSSSSVELTASTYDKDVYLGNIQTIEILGSQTFRGSIQAIVEVGSSVLRILTQATISGTLSVRGERGGVFAYVGIEGATIENDVELREIETLEIINGVHLKKGLRMKRIGNGFVQGRTSTVAIDGPVEDIDGHGALITYGIKFTSSVTVTDREGDFYIIDTNGKPEVNGEIRVEGGRGFVNVRGIGSFVQKFTCKNRDGNTIIEEIAQSNSMSFDTCEHVFIENTTVNDRLSIVDCGSVDIRGSTCRNVMEVKNSIFEVSLSDNLSNNFVDLDNNLDKTTLTNNVFNRIQCTENYKIEASNNRANQVIGNCGFN